METGTTATRAEKGRPIHATTLIQIVRRMREDGIRYRDAVCVFQRRFIEQLLYVHAGHLGKVAKELRVHPNTLTRVLRSLAISVDHLRSVSRTPKREGVRRVAEEVKDAAVPSVPVSID